MSTKEKVVLIYSGGLDSTVLLYHLLAEGKDVHCLSFDYGQRHSRELESVITVLSSLGIEDVVVELPGILFEGSSQTSDDIAVPHGHYTAENMKLTVVPNRNMVMLSLAVAYAISIGTPSVAYAAHAGDHAIYPDCRASFVDTLQAAIYLGNEFQVTLRAPFVDMTKADIVRIGAALDVPFQDTWSCYEGQEFHCGRCGTCVERIEAFQLAGVADPTIYQGIGAE